MTTGAAALALHLTREEAFGLKVGGSERITCWMTPPRRETIPEDGFFRASERWVAGTSGFSARAFRKAGAHAIDEAIWRRLEDTAFHGIPYEEWDRAADGFRDHPRSVAADAWIGMVTIAFSMHPREGFSPIPLTLTGPFGEWTQYREPAEKARPLAWLGPPRLEPKERFLPEPFDGIEPRDMWTQPGRQGFVPAGDFAAAGLLELGDRIDRALSEGEPLSRTWSCQVPLWVGLADG